MTMDLNDIGARAKEASYVLAQAGTTLKNRALQTMYEAFCKNSGKIAAANAQDILAAKGNGMSDAMIDRLTFDVRRVEKTANAILDIIALPDPVGRVTGGSTHPNGMSIEKVTAPLGVIGVIFESRPNVTIDAAALCLKAGNAVILRGGSEAIQSNVAIVQVMRGALEQAGLPADCIQLVEDTTRESALQMMRLNQYIDVLIPRGGAGLIRSVTENASVPVIETGTGNCHIYVDENADIAMAADIVCNAKLSRPSVCNAAESLVVHERVARWALPIIAERLRAGHVEIVGDQAACAILKDIAPATEEDWGKEYLDYKISVKVVKNIDEAIRHINHYSSHHSEAIITENYDSAEKFLAQIDSAAVYVNASTRFTDGGEFGFGAEIGISTQKLHARGQVGLPELVTQKYLIRGKGQIRT